MTGDIVEISVRPRVIEVLITRLIWLLLTRDYHVYFHQPALSCWIQMLGVSWYDFMDVGDSYLFCCVNVASARIDKKILGELPGGFLDPPLTSEMAYLYH